MYISTKIGNNSCSKKKKKEKERQKEKTFEQNRTKEQSIFTIQVLIIHLITINRTEFGFTYLREFVLNVQVEIQKMNRFKYNAYFIQTQPRSIQCGK